MTLSNKQGECGIRSYHVPIELTDAICVTANRPTQICGGYTSQNRFMKVYSNDSPGSQGKEMSGFLTKQNIRYSCSISISAPAPHCKLVRRPTRQTTCHLFEDKCPGIDYLEEIAEFGVFVNVCGRWEARSK